ncbi:carbohydrate ABC transporter permease [Paenibacillus urinalis]|uniref:Carbohydrate ABC transporter permease n=1 Tax=Paenibacillus urinalis TaxID=521520 RepID=A0AAX3N1G6_9BACL|nr:MULTISPECIES: carbohydrate ABC transporter permease [Paenibacillus]WDH82989.1 carbohydrate ABC transporter permease [Paenibacillus urinalis]WDH99041.1 carbohydrate ABC transporter permease [Paenibacillus urinalis]WDI02734.1 carbohydrate ABC transporter permease [Paenibacillus urinalis]GAK40217.1 sugar ABC transporter permease protein [Paenibacillus sp. TCA20]
MMHTSAQIGGTVKSGSSILRKIGYALLYIILIGVAAFQLFPLLWLLLFSLKNNQEVFNLPPLSLPQNPKWENYAKVWNSGNIDVYFFNSVWITVAATVITVVLGSLVTFAITRMKWKGSSLVLGLFMVAMMIPVHSTLIPLFSMFNKVGLTDHPLSLVLSYVAFNMPITIMILLGFYYALPKEVEEAAIIDGCSVNRMFFRIVLPMTSSVIATTGIINMIYNWNEFIFVNTFISSDHYKTLTVGVQNFIGQYTTDWGAIGATLMISILPILVAYMFLSDRIVEGMAAGAVKG